MFYSYQLLSRKAPLGQIWIAATLHSKIKKRNVDRIDIIEICEQILNPAIPLSLRLLGILMGGVVNIFNRKVQFLFDDVHRFMNQVNHMTRIAPPVSDTTVLSRGKSQARFEAITITYGFQETSDQMEQLMMQPKTPSHEHRIFAEDFFLIPQAKNASPDIPMFQADRENITLPEDFTFEDRRQEEIHRFDEEERIILPVDNTLTEDLLAVNLEQQLQQKEQAQGPKSPEPDAESIQPPVDRTAGINKKRKRQRKSVILDEDFMVIQPRVFHSWLHDTSDIVKDNNHRARRVKKTCSSISANIVKLMWYPSTSFPLTSTTRFSSIPCWANPLLELWNENLHGRKTIPKRRPQEGSEGRASPSIPMAKRRNGEDHPMPTDLPEPAGKNANEVDDMANKNASTSIEKLRSRLSTPDVQTTEWDFTHLGLTPIPSGQSVRSRATPASQPLRMVKEDELSPAERSTIRSGDSDHIQIPEAEERVEEINTPTMGVASDFLVETGPSQPFNLTPKDSMDLLSGTVLMHLRDHFNTPGVSKIQSLDQLAQGMDRGQAAKLFFQTCVLATHKYVKVEQEEAYGDIKIQRGPLL